MKEVPVIELGNAGEAVQVGTLTLNKGMAQYIATAMADGLEFKLESSVKISEGCTELVSVFIKGVSK